LQNEGDVLRWYVFQRELEKRLLGFEIPNLQQAIDLFHNAATLHSQRALGVGHGEKFEALKIVKYWQIVECCLFGFCEYS